MKFHNKKNKKKKELSFFICVTIRRYKNLETDAEHNKRKITREIKCLMNTSFFPVSPLTKKET